MRISDWSSDVCSSDLCIETGNLVSNPIDIAVSYSNYAAGAAMAEHLAGLGYRNMGFASLPVRNNDRLRERRRGFVTRLRKLGLPVAQSLILEVGPGLESGSQALGPIVDTERKRVGEGKEGAGSVDYGGGLLIKKNNKQ